MQPLSDKLTSKCVTSYPSALVTSKTTTADCVTSYGMTEAQTEQSLCDMQLLSDKLATRCVTNQLIQIDFDLHMCFVPQRHELFHLAPGQMARHPSL